MLAHRRPRWTHPSQRYPWPAPPSALSSPLHSLQSNPPCGARYAQTDTQPHADKRPRIRRRLCEKVADIERLALPWCVSALFQLQRRRRTCEEEIEADDGGERGGRYEETWEESHYGTCACCNVYRRRWKQVMRPPPRVLLPASPRTLSLLFFYFHTCTSFHTCTLLSIRSQLDMPPKASAAGQHTTKQGTSARTGHSKVLTHGVDSASLKRVREGSLVSLDMFSKKYDWSP